MLKFHGDAIELSGTTGTMLKSEILGKYYEMWWNITSGGDKANHRFLTSIVELNAGTGEDYISDTGKTILGSSGHALELKFNNKDRKDTSNLRIILVEEDKDCFMHLKNVIKRRWPQINLDEELTDRGFETTGLIAINSSLSHSIEKLAGLNLGNSIFFFDPLLYVPYSDISKVADDRIKNFYETHTEFIIFVFTSDWFTGRASMKLCPLPDHVPVESEESFETVRKLDLLFGSQDWREKILQPVDRELKIEQFVKEYKLILHRWFRYVLALPFEPKDGQLYHLFFTSNYEAGMNITRKFYQNDTQNPSYNPSNTNAYKLFCQAHPELLQNLGPKKKPLEWKVLWRIIKDHEDGLCDISSKDLLEKASYNKVKLGTALGWLHAKGYLKTNNEIKVSWHDAPPIFELNWSFLKPTLKIEEPKKMQPLHPSLNK